MRKRAAAVLVVAAAALSGCPTSQPGCTLQNCKAMVEDCRVSFVTFSPFCYGNPANRSPIDEGPYCVEVCNAAAGSGAMAQCISDHASDCRAARDAGTTLDFATLCPSSWKPAEAGCEGKCAATWKSCDDACTGGRPCSSCRMTGGTCADVCPDGGTKTCADCSTPCTVAYLRCSEACPRQ